MKALILILISFSNLIDAEEYGIKLGGGDSIGGYQSIQNQNPIQAFITKHKSLYPPLPPPPSSLPPPAKYQPSIISQEPQVPPVSPIVVPQSNQNPFSIRTSLIDQTRTSAPTLAAAVQSKRYIELIGYANQYEAAQPQVIEVDAITAPVQFVFRSASGPLLFQQIHVPAARQDPQHTRSEEPAQLLTHEVYKPIIQELREVIQPYRHVTQEIKPVLEEVRTIVAHGDKSGPNLASQQQQKVQQQQVIAEESSSAVIETLKPNNSPSLQSLPSSGLKTIQKVPSKIDKKSEDGSNVDFA